MYEKLRLKAVAFLLLSLWAVALMYIYLGVLHSPRKAPDYDAISREIEALRQRVNEGSKNLRLTVEKISLSHNPNSVSASSQTLGLSHEILRYRAINFAHEIFFAVSATVERAAEKLKDDKGGNAEAVLESLRSLATRVEEMTRYLEIDLDGMGRVDHAAEARRTGLGRLSHIVQDRLERLQHPTDCSKAKFLLVDLNRPCAFGCNVHHLAYCLQLAYASGRTLVLRSTSGGYGKWWSENFLPLSKTCDIGNDEQAEELSRNMETDQRAVVCPYIASLSNHKWLPPAIPDDLAPDLIRLHAAPSVWFIGQLMKYLMRPTPNFERLLNATLKSYRLEIPRNIPVAGLHIRRTDKINSEAAFHHLHEYMAHVERRFRFWDSQKLMMNRFSEWIADSQPHYNSTTTRQIFIATDDPSVFNDAAKQYPNYIFHGDVKRAESAGVQQRGQTDSITGIALDIIVLSKVDYIVCTFSSQVCRISYELMQTRHDELGDASGLVQSLDDAYYYGGQQGVLPEVIIEDQASGLKPGQKIHVAGNHWDGFARVLNIPNHPDILIPAYKYRPTVFAVRMGNFDD